MFFKVKPFFGYIPGILIFFQDCEETFGVAVGTFGSFGFVGFGFTDNFLSLASGFWNNIFTIAVGLLNESVFVFLGGFETPSSSKASFSHLPNEIEG